MVANTPPYNLTTNCSSKTTTSMTIQARAYDNDSPAQTLTYKLYWAGSSTAMDTKTGTSGNTVTFTTKTGLAEYTTQTYSWRVEVTDSKSNPISATGTDRTYCSGKTNFCEGIRYRSCGYCYGLNVRCPSHQTGSIKLITNGNQASTSCPVCNQSHLGNFFDVGCTTCNQLLGYGCQLYCPDVGLHLRKLTSSVAAVPCGVCRPVRHRRS